MIELSKISLLKAIHYCNDDSYELMQLAKIDRHALTFWLDNGRIPFVYAARIAKATDQNVSQFDLAPYARLSIADSVFCHCVAQEKNQTLQAKWIIQHGIYALIQAIDRNLLSIESAYEIAQLPVIAQENLCLSYM